VTKEFAEQPQCRGLVALGLNENFENLAFAVNGTRSRVVSQFELGAVFSAAPQPRVATGARRP
jgi:myo-inositol catabolism protein IolC